MRKANYYMQFTCNNALSVAVSFLYANRDVKTIVIGILFTSYRMKRFAYLPNIESRSCEY